jgi:hypothetical protein
MSDPVDELLTAAGRRWRAAQPPPAEPDPSRWTADPAPARRSRVRRWAPALAAGLATAVAAGAVHVVSARHSVPPAPVDRVAAEGAARLIVRDGDEAQASGMVVAVPGQPVRFCAPAPVPAIGSLTPRPPACDYGVPVTGVDLARLSSPVQHPGFRYGSAHLRGTWRAGTLAVTAQSAPEVTPTVPDNTPPLPCGKPAGGWKRHTDELNTDGLRAYVEQTHPDRFRPLWVSYPEGFTNVAGTPMPTDGIEVYVVEVVHGDVAAERRSLQHRYDGNLCVVASAGRPSIADQHRIEQTVGKAVNRLMDDRANGIYTSWMGDTVKVDMVILTPQLYDKLAAIGFAALDPQPWLRPVR